jgi:branched-chain amino acid transport system ATP-binding protein
MAENLLLEGHGLGKNYAGVVALSDVALTLERGEILGLVGPNGAGKTTLVDLISGAQAATSGSLTLEGQSLRGPASHRAKMGLARTFQHPQLALEMSVRDNLLLGRVAANHSSALGMVMGAFRGCFRSIAKDDVAAVDRIAEEINLDRLDREARDLTLGEQRLVEVGRAMAQNPTVLLLDEPFAGADPNGVIVVNEVIRKVQQRGHGVILVDHNVDLVSALVDRIMLLNEGRVIFDGDPQACLASPEMQQVYFGGGTSIAP